MRLHPCSLPVPALWSFAITAWILTLQAAQLSRNTITTRRDHLQRAARALGGSPWEVTPEQLLAWVAGQAWQRETRRSVYASLRSFWRWAVEAGWCEQSPAARLPRVRPGEPVPRPTPEPIYREALAEADRRTGLIIAMGAQLGMRRGEIAQVHERDLLPDLLGWSLLVHGKGGYCRVLPLPHPLDLVLIEACRAGGGYAFPGRIDGHLSAQRIGNLASRTMPKDWTLHTLRHRAGTVALAGGADLLTIQQMLGHHSVASTQRYVKPPATALRRAVEHAAA